MPNLTRDPNEDLYRRTRNGAMWPFAPTSNIFLVGDLDIGRRTTYEFPQTTVWSMKARTYHI